MEGFRVVLGQGDDKEGANILNVRIWVEGAVLEYEPRYIANSLGGILTTYGHAEGVPGCRYKQKSCVGKSMMKTVQGGPIQRRLLVCWLNKGRR